MNKRFNHILAGMLVISLAMSLCLLGCGGSSGGGNKLSASPQAAPSSAAYSGSTNNIAAPAPEPEEWDYWSYDDTETAAEAPMDGSASATAGQEEPQFVMPDSRKIIRHASMDLETQEFDAALRSIQQAVANAGGYIESQDQGGGTSYASRGRYQEERYASIQARVPSGKLNEVISSVGGFCNVLSQSESMEDITDNYYDVQAHLNTLRIQEERLLAILEKAEKLEDVITLESALSDVRYQIESLTASLRRMDSQVTYSYLNLSLREVVEYQVVQEKPRTFGERLKEAGGDGLEDMVNGLQSFAISIARIGPSLLVWLAIILCIVLAVRAISRAIAKRQEAKGLPPRGSAPSAYTTTGPRQPKFQRYPQQPQPPAPGSQPPVPPANPQNSPSGEQNTPKE